MDKKDLKKDIETLIRHLRSFYGLLPMKDESETEGETIYSSSQCSILTYDDYEEGSFVVDDTWRIKRGDPDYDSEMDDDTDIGH